MAGLAAEAELAAMDVAMAVGASAAHVGELQRQVARTAGDPLVAAIEGSSDFTVLEVRLLTYGFPGLFGMTLHAIEIEIAVRAAAVFLGFARRYGDQE
jgi:hypothetical protein